MSTSAQTAVVTDSTSYLPEGTSAERGIEQASLYVTLDGDQKREIDVSDYERFFAKLRGSDEGATTSQPSVGDFTAVYRPLLAAGKEIVSIHISAGISGTFESASQAKRQLTEEGAGGERIEVYDSRSTCGGMGLVTLAASKAAAGGGSGAEVLAQAQRARKQLQMWFSIDTLEYLRKGGRIGAARAWLGTALQIKPILTLEEEITPVERVRTRRRVFERLVEFARELEQKGRGGWVVQHIHDAENAERLVAECREIFGNDPIFVSQVGPVIGAHTGPGLLGVGGIPRDLVA